MTAIVPGQASGLDDVLEYANLAAFPVSGKISKIYVALDSNLTYRWTGSTYAVLDPSLALGETSNTAYRGDRGKTAYDHSQATGNPHGTETNLAYTASATQGVVISDTGTDATIPAADGTNAGLFLPAEKTKLSGIAAGAEVNVNADWNAVSGDAQILNKPTVTTDHTALSNIGTNTHAQIDSHIASTANPHSITKTQVGLGNVANTDTTTTANITDSTDKRFVTDAQRTVLSNTGGINTGDNATNSQYSGLATSKQDALVSGTNIKTINSTSLLGSGNINLVTSPAGSTTQIQFNNAGAFGASSNLTYSGGQLLVASPATGTIPSVVKGFSGQTANLQEWRNSDGVVLACVSASGSVGMGGGVHP